VKNQEEVIKHFDKYPLKTKKFLSYTKYKEIISEIKLGKHLTDSGRKRLKEKAKRINV